MRTSAELSDGAIGPNGPIWHFVTTPGYLSINEQKLTTKGRRPQLAKRTKKMKTKKDHKKTKKGKKERKKKIIIK